MVSNERVAPPETLMVTINKKPRELTMYWGLLSELLAIIGDVNNIGAVALAPNLRGEIFKAVLSDRNENGLITKAIEPASLHMTPKDAQAILSWVGEHALDFFLVAVEEAVRVASPLATLTAPAPNSMFSGNGS